MTPPSGLPAKEDSAPMAPPPAGPLSDPSANAPMVTMTRTRTGHLSGPPAKNHVAPMGHSPADHPSDPPATHAPNPIQDARVGHSSGSTARLPTSPNPQSPSSHPSGLPARDHLNPMAHPPADHPSDPVASIAPGPIPHVLPDRLSGPPANPGPIPKQETWAGHTLPATSTADALLLVYADALDDFERTRIATANRVRALRDLKGMDGTPEEDRLLGMVEGLKALEHGVELELRRALRTHPLGPWVKATIGVGEKQGARLLAAIGDPYWHAAEDRPRLVSELWAFAGYHVVAGEAPRPRRGVKANWSRAARMRAFLVAESCVKKRASPYRPVYDEGRARYAEAVHAGPCVRCGPAGRPAAVGSPLNPGHQHARALRLVAKAVLRDLWVESKRLHEERSTGN